MEQSVSVAALMPRDQKKWIRVRRLFPWSDLRLQWSDSTRLSPLSLSRKKKKKNSSLFETLQEALKTAVFYFPGFSHRWSKLRHFHLISPLCPHFTSASAGWLHVQRANFTSLFEPHYVFFFPPLLSLEPCWQPVRQPALLLEQPTAFRDDALGILNTLRTLNVRLCCLCWEIQIDSPPEQPGPVLIIGAIVYVGRLILFFNLFMVLSIVRRIDCKLRRNLPVASCALFQAGNGDCQSVAVIWTSWFNSSFYGK